MNKDDGEYAKTWKELNEKYPAFKWAAGYLGFIMSLVLLSCVWPTWMIYLAHWVFG